jgi:hypothetical protein
MTRIRRQERFIIEPPPGYAIGAASNLKAGYTAQVLDAEQQDDIAVDRRGPRIEDGVGRVRQLSHREDWIVGVAYE